MASQPTPMRQLFSPLIEYGKITTTEAKAKVLKRQMERLISRSKKLDLVVRRKILALFPQKQISRKFLEQVVPQFSAKGGSAAGGKERVGGYVRVVKLPHRLGDHAPMARVEFVEEIKKDLGEPKPVKNLSNEKKTPEKNKSVKTAVKKSAKRIKNVKNKNNKIK